MRVVLLRRTADGKVGRDESLGSMKQKYEGKDLQGLVDLGREQGYLTFDRSLRVQRPSPQLWKIRAMQPPDPARTISVRSSRGATARVAELAEGLQPAVGGNMAFLPQANLRR
jgi:hypothetical protein